MTEKRDDHEQKPDQGFEVRYAEKFLREKRREDKRTWLFGAGLMLFLGIALLYESFRAHRAHTWVDLGTRINNSVLFPPIFGLAAGVLVLFLSGYLLWNYFQEK